MSKLRVESYVGSKRARLPHWAKKAADVLRKQAALEIKSQFGLLVEHWPCLVVFELVEMMEGAREISPGTTSVSFHRTWKHDGLMIDNIYLGDDFEILQFYTRVANAPV